MFKWMLFLRGLGLGAEGYPWFTHADVSCMTAAFGTSFRLCKYSLPKGICAKPLVKRGTCSETKA